MLIVLIILVLLYRIWIKGRRSLSRVWASWIFICRNWILILIWSIRLGLFMSISIIRKRILAWKRSSRFWISFRRFWGRNLLLMHIVRFLRSAGVFFKGFRRSLLKIYACSWRKLSFRRIMFCLNQMKLKMTRFFTSLKRAKLNFSCKKKKMF